MATLSPAVLMLTLIGPTLDLLGRVQPGAALPILATVATGAASAVLLFTWLRYPRTSWLAAATLAGLASVALRLVGLELAPALSLLGVVALGIGGAFASPARESEAWLG